MSVWTDFRDKFEAIFSPEAEEAIKFAHAIKSDVLSEGKGDLSKAFIAGYTTYASAEGNFEQKIIASASAFLLELIGDVVSIVKKEAVVAEQPVVAVEPVAPVAEAPVA